MRLLAAVTAALLLLGGSTPSPAAPRPVPLAHDDSGGPGPVVVLLHGHPQTRASWQGVVPLLSPRLRVLAVDVRGQGGSPSPDGPYDAETRARDVAALLRGLAVRDAVVVGADLGGHVAVALAAAEPALVARLAVVEAVLPGTAAAAGPLSSPHVARHAAVAGDWSRVQGRERAHVDAFVCGGRAPCPHPPALLAGAADALAVGAFAPYPELLDPPPLPRLRQPVLAVGGADGLGALPAASLREVAADVRGAVLPGVGHWAAEEAPAALAAVLLPFALGG